MGQTKGMPVLLLLLLPLRCRISFEMLGLVGDAGSLRVEVVPCAMVRFCFVFFSDGVFGKQTDCSGVIVLESWVRW